MKPEPAPRIVYSTDPARREAEAGAAPARAPAGLPAPEGQSAALALEKRPKGKVVTLVCGIRAHPAGLEALAARLKASCGAGGTVREGTIEIQGDHRAKVAAALEQLGYGVRRKG